MAALQEEVAAQQAIPDDAGQAVETILSRLVQDAQVQMATPPPTIVTQNRRHPPYLGTFILTCPTITYLQERLIYCALLVLRDDIESFKPTSADLDYPNRLYAPETPAVADAAAAGTSGSSAASLTHSLYATWYSPLRNTLVLLSKVYRAVDMSVFQDLAGEAVGLCTDALKRASVTISSAQSPDDGDLFLIKHLLVLREQLTPFDINFAAIKRRLDFSSTREALSNFVRGPGRMFR